MKISGNNPASMGIANVNVRRNIDFEKKMDKPSNANEKKSIPPGLESVQTRFQNIPEAERTVGQNNANERISRNIQRYVEAQSVVPSEETSTSENETSTNADPSV